MKKLITQCQKAFADLSERDKQLLVFTAPIVFLLLFYIAFYRPISEYHSNAISNLEVASDDYYWLRAQAPLSGNRYCGRLSSDAANNRFLSQQAKRDGLAVTVSELGSTVTISVGSAKGAAVLRYSNNLACNGYEVISISINRLAEAGDDVSGVIIVDASAVRA
jgi:type II secretory pathway component PulM